MSLFQHFYCRWPWTKLVLNLKHLSFLELAIGHVFAAQPSRDFFVLSSLATAKRWLGRLYKVMLSAFALRPNHWRTETLALRQVAIEMNTLRANDLCNDLESVSDMFIHRT